MEQLRENLHLKARLAEHLARCLLRPLSRWLLLQLVWVAMELEEEEVAGLLAKKELQRHREAQVVLTKLVMLDHVEQQEETRGGSCAACDAQWTEKEEIEK